MAADWPSYQFDAANTGHTEHAAPSRPVDVRWESDAYFESIGSPVVGNDLLIAGGQDGTVYAHSVDDGQTVWTFETDGAVWSTPSIHDGTVIVGSRDRSLYSLDLATGERRWRITTGGPIESSPTVADGRCYVGSNDGALYAIDAVTGAEQWQRDLDARICAVPAVSDRAVVAADWYGTIVAFDPSSGDEQWRFAADAVVSSSPTIAGDRVFFGDSRGRLWGLGLKDGEDDWVVDIGRTVLGSPAVHDGVVFAPSGNTEPANTPVNGPGPFVALSATDGSELWRTGTPDGPIEPQVWGAPITDGETVYTGSASGVYALDAADGEVQWHHEGIQGFPWSAPALSDGSLYLTHRYEGPYAFGEG